MGISAGLVGLPNVGKSTLFNALTKSSVPAENYPFCTIEPHIACTAVPDERISKLQAIFKSPKLIPATVQFVDIAGLVKGAASGEGLGNQFLNNIREVDLILHVLRCFSDSTITYSRADELNPLVDFEIITTELMLKDMESIEKRKEKIKTLFRAAKTPAQTKELEQETELLKNIEEACNREDFNGVQRLVKEAPVKTVPLLSAKNFLIVANISEQEIQDDLYKQNPNYKLIVEKFGEDKVIPVSARFEYEVSLLNPEDQAEMCNMVGLKERGLDRIIAKTYHNLGLITFFTCGPKEIHAWPIKKGISVRQAAGEIHSDLERGFICADVFNCADLFAYGTEVKLKEAGKIRVEGQDYKVQDGDLLNIKFNV